MVRTGKRYCGTIICKLFFNIYFQSDMAVNLVEIFMEKVEERCRLASDVT